MLCNLCYKHLYCLGGICMKKIIFLGLILGLVGCSNSVDKIVKQQLKDPDSAQFKDVKGQCGLVNSKNSYGGYTGFKRFYVSNSMVQFDNEDDENPLKFELEWMAHCEIDSKLSSSQKDACASLGNFAAAVVRSKLAGVSITKSKDSIKADTNEELALYFKIIDDGYKSSNKNEFAVSILNDCMSGRINVPS